MPTPSFDKHCTPYSFSMSSLSNKSFSQRPNNSAVDITSLILYLIRSSIWLDSIGLSQSICISCTFLYIIVTCNSFKDTRSACEYIIVSKSIFSNSLAYFHLFHNSRLPSLLIITWDRLNNDNVISSYLYSLLAKNSMQ